MAETGRILLVAAGPDLDKALSEGMAGGARYEFMIESGSKALEQFKQAGFDAVVIGADLSREKLEPLIQDFKKIDEDCVLIVIIKGIDPQLAARLSAAGAYEVMPDPPDIETLGFLIGKAAQLHTLASANRRLIQGLREHNTTLEKQNILLARRIEDSTKNLSRLYEDLHSTYLRTVKVLAQAIDARDHYTHSHSENVARYATAIAAQMHLSVRDIEVIREACELHDLGKIGIEDSILSKPGPLNKEEWEQIKRHPVVGAQILEPLTFLNDVTALVRQHHEHYDGTGYPEGRKGEDILLGARIIHLADAYESMRSARSYRKVPLSRADAIEEIKRNTGTQFDPKAVRVFLNVVDNL